jgi:hypothetical protein
LKNQLIKKKRIMKSNSTPHEMTLGEILCFTGDDDHAAMLTDAASAMTSSDAAQFINGTNVSNYDAETKKSLRQLALTRIKQGKSVLPWGSHAEVDPSSEGDMEAGFC